MQVLEHGNEDESSAIELAKQVGEALNKYYPNHPWLVGFQGGHIVVKHLAIEDAVHAAIGKRGFSMARPYNKLVTHKEITAECVLMGGMLLEQFKLPRGAWDGRDPVVPGYYNRATPFKRKGLQ
jgi:hypothetical protein